jgi:hypothetical protein
MTPKPDEPEISDSRLGSLANSEAEFAVLGILRETEQDVVSKVIRCTLIYARARDKARGKRGIFGTSKNDKKKYEKRIWSAFRSMADDLEHDKENTPYLMNVYLEYTVWCVSRGEKFSTYLDSQKHLREEQKALIGPTAALIVAMEAAQRENSDAASWEKVLTGLQSKLAQDYLNGQRTSEQGGQGLSLAKNVSDFPSRQPGYEQPSRKDKVIVKTYVKEDVREDFRRIAKAAGLTAETLLAQLVSTTVEKKNEPGFIDSLIEDAERRTKANKNLLRKVGARILKNRR